MAVSLLVNGIQRTNLVLAGIPVHLQVLLLVLLAENLVKIHYHLFISAALKRNRFALVVKAYMNRKSAERRVTIVFTTHLDLKTR